MTKKKQPPTVAVIDAETDPFAHGRAPRPFMWGFYDGTIYKEFWGDSLSDCSEQLLDYIRSREDTLLIYAHNGGKFDFLFLLEYGAVQNPVLVINGRITKAQFCDRHEIRDSYAMIPLPLKKLVGGKHGDKLDIDYAKMEKEVRDQHRDEISFYCKQDCVVLFDYIMAFRARFGDKLTVGGAAITELGKFHHVSKQNKGHDDDFRKYYYGGRVECFEGGILEAPEGRNWLIHDVNSMYPDAMKRYIHPTGQNYVELGEHSCARMFNKKTGAIKGINDSVYFIHFTGANRNAIPKRDDETGNLRFDIPYGEFLACSHEVKVALDLGLLRIDKVHSVHVPMMTTTFGDFVDHFSAEKISAKKSGDAAGETFAKLMLNSAYGKFGSNANEFKDWFIFDSQGDFRDTEQFKKWREKNPVIRNVKTGERIASGAELVDDYGRFEIWQAPAPSERGFFDVAVAASITSAARSNLLRAINGAERPIYCDTDSLISLDISGVTIHDSELGAWKFEGSSKCLYIGGKKLYTCQLNELDKKGKVQFKSASKGAHLSHEQIIEVARGQVVKWSSEAPNMKLTGDVKFVARNVRANFSPTIFAKEFAQPQIS